MVQYRGFSTISDIDYESDLRSLLFKLLSSIEGSRSLDDIERGDLELLIRLARLELDEGEFSAYSVWKYLKEKGEPMTYRPVNEKCKNLFQLKLLEEVPEGARLPRHYKEKEKKPRKRNVHGAVFYRLSPTGWVYFWANHSNLAYKDIHDLLEHPSNQLLIDALVRPLFKRETIDYFWIEMRWIPRYIRDQCRYLLEELRTAGFKTPRDANEMIQYEFKYIVRTKLFIIDTILRFLPSESPFARYEIKNEMDEEVRKLDLEARERLNKKAASILSNDEKLASMLRIIEKDLSFARRLLDNARKESNSQRLLEERRAKTKL